MKRVLIAVLALGVVASGCDNTDRYERHFSNPVPAEASAFKDTYRVDKHGDVYAAVGTRIVRFDPDRPATQKPTEVSAGWVNPKAFAFDDRDRLWVADQARPDGRELVARGKERNGAKRRRFASALPPNSRPSAITVIKDELYVCRSAQHDVYRLHIGIDRVARRRGVVPRLRCDSAITHLADGSLVTENRGVIRRYPPR